MALQELDGRRAESQLPTNLAPVMKGRLIPVEYRKRTVVVVSEAGIFRIPSMFDSDLIANVMDVGIACFAGW